MHFLDTENLLLQFFFVLSGYFSYKKINRKVGVTFVKRFLRVYIPFFFAIIIAYAIGFINSKHMFFDAIELKQVYAHFWTIPVEIKFYFAFMLFAGGLFCCEILKKYIVAVLVVVSVACAYFFPPGEWPPNSQDVRWYIPIFGVGIIVAILNQKMRRSLIFDFLFVGILFYLIIELPIVQYIIWKVPMDSRWMNKYLFFGVLAGFLLLCITNSVVVKKIFADCRFLQCVGRCSYSLYLLHHLVLWKLNRMELEVVSWCILFVVITVAATVVFYEILEKRFVKIVVNAMLGEESAI